MSRKIWLWTSPTRPIGTTEKAILIEAESGRNGQFRAHWLPKSMLRAVREDMSVGYVRYWLDLPEWLADREQLWISVLATGKEAQE